MSQTSNAQKNIVMRFDILEIKKPVVKIAKLHGSRTNENQFNMSNLFRFHIFNNFSNFYKYTINFKYF